MVHSKESEPLSTDPELLFLLSSDDELVTFRDDPDGASIGDRYAVDSTERKLILVIRLLRKLLCSL